MTLRLSEHWVWDFWIAQEGSDYHIFYLKAPRALGNPELRHWHTSIGHAVSVDLTRWEILPDALAPSNGEGAWDNYTTWTGSVLQNAGAWYMLYTGTNRTEKGLVQRIGLAISDDLMNWQRYPGNPIIIADPQWYEILDQNTWHDQAWRDPFVFEHQGEFHAYITARSNSGGKYSRGVIGHARSSDLFRWEVCAPVTDPGEFAYLEVPQLVEMDGRWYLLFSVGHDKYAESRLARPAVKRQTGTHYLVADHPYGPFIYLSDDFMVGDDIGTLYAGKVIRNPQGDWVYMAFNLFAQGNHFIGEIVDPMPVRLGTSGHLTVMQDMRP
jgi:beta-fructofuranosidase